MKELAITVAALLLAAGCSTMSLERADRAYRVAKGVYQIGKKVVIINQDLIGEEALESLKQIDEYAGRVDKVHDLLKEEAPTGGAAPTASNVEFSQ